MPAFCMKAYAKHGEENPADSRAICKASTPPTTWFVLVSAPEEQAVLMLLRRSGVTSHRSCVAREVSQSLFRQRLRQPAREETLTLARPWCRLASQWGVGFKRNLWRLAEDQLGQQGAGIGAHGEAARA